MKKLLTLAMLVSASSQAATGLISTSVEPIIGYERVHKFLPTQHTRERLVYGVRATAGFLLLSAEGEYTRAMDTEEFTATSQTIKDTEDRARLGARTNLRLTGFLSFIVRAGAQASMARHEITTSGTTVTTVDPIKYRPYAGAGLRVSLARNVALNADITTVFHNFPNMNNNDYLTTASLAVHFP